MFCARCGAEAVGADALFCHRCGGGLVSGDKPRVSNPPAKPTRTDEQTPETSASGWGPVRWIAAIGLAIVLLVALGGIGFAKFQYRQERPTQTQARAPKPLGAAVPSTTSDVGGSGGGTPLNANSGQGSTTGESEGAQGDCRGSDLIELQQGAVSGNLASYGIWTNSPETGEFVGAAGVVDQMWQKWFGSPTADVPMSDVRMQLDGGWLGNDLRNFFGDSPSLYDRMYQEVLAKAKRHGAYCSSSSVMGE